MTQPRAETDFPRRGQIIEVNLDPVIGSEIGKRRPALVISNDANNQFSRTVTLLPITSQASKRVYEFETTLPQGVGGLVAESRVKCNQIRTVDKRRIVSVWGTIPDSYLQAVEKALKIHLQLE